MSPAVSLIIRLIGILVFVMIWRKLAPYVEAECVDRGMERAYSLCVRIGSYLVVLAVAQAIVGFAFRLALQAVTG